MNAYLQRVNLAYLHLSSIFEESLQKGYFGIAHLEGDNELLIFHSCHPAIIKFYHGVDLLSGDNLKIAHNQLKKAYLEEKIKVDCRIDGEMFKVLKGQLKFLYI